MPNDCSNTLVVSGSKEDLLKFYEEIKSDKEVISFSKVAPMPKEEEDNWYCWSYDNWGVKWDAYDSYIDSGVVYFCTAWGPAEKAYSKIANAYPTLHFQFNYYEMGMMFVGELVFDCGELVHEFYLDVHSGNAFYEHCFDEGILDKAEYKKDSYGNYEYYEYYEGVQR